MWLAPLHFWVNSEAFPDHILKNSPTLSAILLPPIPDLFLYLKYSTFWHFKYYCYVLIFLFSFVGHELHKGMDSVSLETLNKTGKSTLKTTCWMQQY